jgi:preprotein translocase subunit YajC
LNTLAIAIDGLMTLAQATQPTTRPTPPPWMQFLSSPMFLLVLLIVLFYVFMFRSKKKQDRQRQDMLTNLKKGDRVQTIGGILGTVIEARPDEVLLKVDENSNTKIRFSRSAIHRVLEEEKA